MRIAYFDCFSGISGDMTLGALIDAGIDAAAIGRSIESLGLADCRLEIAQVMRGAFRATHVNVKSEPEHVHRHLRDVLALVARSDLSDRQKELAEKIFRRVAEAEAKVHGTTVEKVHFHEVGAVDSIADIVGVAVGLDLLGAQRIVSSAVPTGCGQIRIAHGNVAVPAPGTAELLINVPLAASTVEAELTTPTGAAILTSVADSFGPMPAMVVERIGYGAGTRELKEQPNVLRLFVGEDSTQPESDIAWMLETNLDDVAGELVGYCVERLWDGGALDVYSTPIQMKKNRPGVKLSVLCCESQISLLAMILFEETATLGVRRWPVQRHKLARRPHRVATQWGEVDGKLGWQAGSSRPSFAPEYESCRQIAQQHGVALREVYSAATRAFDPALCRRPDE